MNRMKWNLTASGRSESTCGRFEVGGAIFVGCSTYVRLFDRKTGKEYPCRTLESAKAGARNLARQDTDRESEAATLAAEDVEEWEAREASM